MFSSHTRGDGGIALVTFTADLPVDCSRSKGWWRALAGWTSWLVSKPWGPTTNTHIYIHTLSALDEHYKYIGITPIQHLFHRRSEIKALHWMDKKQMIDNDCFLFTLSNGIHCFILHTDSSNYQRVVPGLVQIGSQIDFSPPSHAKYGLVRLWSVSAKC